MRIKLFVRRNCPRCPEAKAITADLRNVEHYDVDEIEGLSEAAFYGVLSTPSIVVVNGTGKEVASWRGEVPSKEDLASLISQ